MEEIELSVEQKERIALSRQKALKRKLEVVEEQKAAESALANDSLSCQRLNDETGLLCGNQPVAKDLLLTFGESCCEICRHLTDEFSLLNKTDVAAQFLLPQDSIKMMPFATKINPRNSSFAPMKLYLRKHAMEKSFKRWGDAEGLLREIDRREKEKFDRNLVDCENALELGRDIDSSLEFNNGGGCNSIADLLSAQSEQDRDNRDKDIAPTEGEDMNKKRGRKAKLNSVVQKRSLQLGKMMAAIKSAQPP